MSMVDWMKKQSLWMQLLLLGGAAFALLALIAGIVLIFVKVLLWGIVLIGAAFIVAVMLLIAILRRPSDNKLAEGLGSWAQSVSVKGNDQELAALKSKFVESIQPIRVAAKGKGVNLYTIPWYLLVGTAGCGKTEMIRRSGIPFLAKDPSQGKGGTRFLDIWPSDQGIMIDAAGGVFTEGGPVWDQFLDLLKKARPRCPINGVILAIGADNLLKDTDEKVALEGGPIRARLEQIQKILGVRFPVFVVVTKSDLIPGFRGFCEQIQEPDLQHQMVGWAESRPLTSEPRLAPSEVGAYLGPWLDRLKRKREGVLLNPGTTDETRTRRIDLVDEVYELPFAMENKIVKRLQRYLESIFSANQGVFASADQKPLFVRGIFFTTALREGRVLDEHLAQSLGIQMDQLPPERRPWEMDRPFFIRELLEKKIFPEKGLVSGAANIGSYVLWRRVAMLAAGFLVFFGLALGIWLAQSALGRSVGQASEFWKAEKVALTSSGPSADSQRSVLKRDGVFYTWNTERAEQVGKAFDVAATRVNIGFPFYLITGRDDVAPEERALAARVLATECAISPVVRASRDMVRRVSPDLEKDKLPQGVDIAKVRESRVAALAELLRMETIASGQKTTAPSDTPNQLSLSTLAKAASPGLLVDKPRAQSLADLETTKLKDVLKKSSNEKNWPPATWDFGTGSSRDDLGNAIEQFTRDWDGQLKKGSEFDLLTELGAGLKDYQASEKKLLDIGARPVATVAEFGTLRTDWKTQVDDLKRRATALDELSAKIKQRADATPAEALTKVRDRLVSRSQAEYNLLLGALPEPAEKTWPESQADTLAKARDKFQKSADNLVKALSKEWEDNALSPLVQASGDKLEYQARLDAYDALDKALAAAEPEGEKLLGDPLKASASAVTSLGATRSATDAGKLNDTKVKDTLAKVREIVTRRQIGAGLETYWKFVSGASGSPDPIGEAVAKIATEVTVSLPAVPMTAAQAGAIAPSSRPEQAVQVLGALVASRAVFNQGSPATAAPAGGAPAQPALKPIADAAAWQALEPKLKPFAEKVAGDWDQAVRSVTSVKAGTWREIKDAMCKGSDSNGAINDRLNKAVDALTKLQGVPDAGVSDAAKVKLDALTSASGFKSKFATGSMQAQPASGKWCALNDQPATARDAVLLAVSSGQISEYLVGVQQGVPYWKELTEAGLSALSKEGADQLSADLGVWSRVSGSFPIKYNGSGTVARNELADLDVALDRLLKLADAQSSGLPALDELLAKGRVPSGQEIRRTKSIAAMLKSGGDWKINILGENAGKAAQVVSGNDHATNTWSYVEVTCSGKKIFANTFGMNNAEIGAVDPGCSALTLGLFKFGNGTKDPADLSREIVSGDWPVLRWLAQNRGSVKKTSEGKIVFAQPVETTSVRRVVPVQIDAPSGFDVMSWLELSNQ